MAARTHSVRNASIVSPGVQLTLRDCGNSIIIYLAPRRSYRTISVTIEEMISALSAEEPPQSLLQLTINNVDNPEVRASLNDIFAAIHQDTWIDILFLSIHQWNIDPDILLDSFRGKTGISTLFLGMSTTPKINAKLVSVLETLNFTSLVISGFEHIEGIAEALATHDKLKAISVGFIEAEIDQRISFLNSIMRIVPILNMKFELAQQELDVIAERLKTDSVVEILNLRRANSINLDALDDALRTNTTLKSLKINTSQVSRRYDSIFTGLRFNTGLIKLDIRAIDVQDIPSLIEMLQDNKTLEALKLKFDDLRLRDLPPMEINQLARALRNSSLLELSILNKNVRLSLAVRAVSRNRHNAMQKDSTLLKLLL